MNDTNHQHQPFVQQILDDTQKKKPTVHQVQTLKAGLRMALARRSMTLRDVAYILADTRGNRPSINAMIDGVLSQPFRIRAERHTEDESIQYIERVRQDFTAMPNAQTAYLSITTFLLRQWFAGDKPGKKLLDAIDNALASDTPGPQPWRVAQHWAKLKPLLTKAKDPGALLQDKLHVLLGFATESKGKRTYLDPATDDFFSAPPGAPKK